MSSDLKVTNIKHASSGSNNLVLASNGDVSITNTLSAGTIGGNVVFPAGSLIDYDLVSITSTVNLASSGGTADVDSTIIEITLPANSTAIISAGGGKLFGSSGTTRRLSVALISYTTDGTDPTNTSNIIYGGECTYASPTGTVVVPGFVEGEVSNSTGSDKTLKWTWGVTGTGSLNGEWQTEVSGRGQLSLKTLIFKD